MTAPLALRVPHRPGETPQSLASRLAARNGGDLGELARHMRLSPTALANGRPGGIERLAALAAVDPDSLRREATVEGGDVWTHRGEALTRATMRRHRLMVCPRCLAEDLAGSEAPSTAAYGRSCWMIEPVRTCPGHGVALAEADAPPNQAHRMWDFARRVAPLLPRIHGLADAAAPRAPSRLQRYLLARLDGARDGGWLDGLAFHVVVATCEWVGAVALHGPHVTRRGLDADGLRAADDVGYEIASDGIRGLGAFCDGMRGVVGAAKSNTDGQKALGHFWHYLLKHADDDHAPVREALAGLMAAAKPVPRGRTVLGVPVRARLTHSITTGALATGVHVKTFRAVLEREGLLDPEAPRAAPGSTTIAADRLADVIGRLGTSLNQKDAMAYLNAPRHAAEAICQAGIVVPRSRMTEGARSRKLYLEYARDDLDAFLAALAAGAERRDAAGPDEVDVQTAAHRNHCGIAEVVRLVLDHRLPWVGCLGSERGFESVLVRSGDVAPLVRGPEPAGLSQGRVRHRLRAHHGSIPVLVGEGMLETFEARHPRTRAPQRYVSLDSLARFEAAYASLSTRALELGMPANRLKARLEACGIEPALTADLHLSAFYLRGDLSRYAGDERGGARVTGRSARRRAGTKAGSPRRRATGPGARGERATVRR